MFRVWLSRAFLGLATTTALASQPVLQAHAFELFGIKFFEDEEADEDLVISDPQPYEVTVEVTDEDLQETVENASNLWNDREEPASGTPGLLAKAKGDYRRILAALYTEGRYGGVISITIGGREAIEIEPDAKLPDPVAVTVRVDPGPLFTFGRADIVNQAPPPVDQDDEVPLPAEEGFATGEPALSGAVLRAERLATDAWRELGYPKAEAASREVVADHRTDLLDAVITMEPGRRAAFGPISVTGTERMNPAFVARQTGLTPGVEYDPDAIDRAEERLTRLEVFRALQFEEAETVGPDGLLPIEVVVQERELRRFGIGGTYSTVDGAGIETYWLHRNLFGQAERLRLDARVSGIGAERDGEHFRPDNFNYFFGITFTRPGTITPDTDLVAALAAERQVLESYTETSFGGQLGFTHFFTPELTGKLALTGERSRFEDDLGIREFLTTGVLGGLTWDTRDNPADATEGFFLEAQVEPFYEFEYGNPAIRSTVEGRTYFGFGEEDRIVLAGRLKLGTLAGPSIEQIPPDRLFFAGGGGSVRGYAYRNIGVLREDGILTGGRSLIEASAEIRADVTETIGVVAFADAGYVGEETFPDFAEDIKIGVGGGLRYNTGLGPLRLDVAIPLDPGPDDPDYAFYVGIGHAF